MPAVVTTPGVPERLRPTPLETACGLALGIDDEATQLVLRRDLDARHAIDDTLRQALARPPCLVSFSGGRDSSVVLAAATALARRERLPLPIPISYRFAAAPGSHERDWQERVIAHLGLTDWERLDLGAELDAIGPVAQDVLRRHGPLWPFNTHFHEPLLRRAAGGSLLTGVGGDEIFGRGVWADARAVIGGRRRPRPRDVRTVALPLVPMAVRRRRMAQRHEVRWPWLPRRPTPQRTCARRLARRHAAAVEPGDRLVVARRFRRVLAASLEALASAAGARLVQPFFDAASVGVTDPATGPRSRRPVVGECAIYSATCFPTPCGPPAQGAPL